MDKVIVSHRGALRDKYGDQGLDLIISAVDELVAADAKRGLQTEVIFIDDADAMQKLGGKPSTRKRRVARIPLIPHNSKKQKMRSIPLRRHVRPRTSCSWTAQM